MNVNHAYTTEIKHVKSELKIKYFIYVTNLVTHENLKILMKLNNIAKDATVH